MADDNKANYGRIGFFIVLCFTLALLTLAYLGGMGGDRYEFLCETYFSYPVSGLDVGSAVNFRGVKVGTVKRISFIGAEYGDECADEDQQVIWVLMALDRRQMGLADDESPAEVGSALVAKGLHTVVSASGITGLSKIEVNFPKTKVVDAPISWKPRYMCIPPAPSILQSAADSATHILAQINQLDLVRLWTNAVNAAASAATVLDSSATLIDSERGVVDEILLNVREASVNLREFTRQLKENPSLVIRDRQLAPLEETR